MYLNTSTVSASRAVEVNTAALDILRDSIVNGGDTMLEISLLSLFFGVLTVLSFTSMYLLLHHRSLAQTSVRILVLSTVLLYLSNVTYVAALIWNRTQVHHLTLGAMDGLFSPSYDGSHEMAVFEDGMRKQSPMAIFALEVNWMIGDSVVWWRACVIWRNRVIYCIGPLLVALTLVSGMCGLYKPDIVWTTGLWFLDVYNPFLEAFAFFSLTTNILATSLIACKAWEHRRSVKKYLSATGAKSQVLKTLAFLVESGTVYCVVTIFFIINYTRGMLVPSPASSAETKAAIYFDYGCIGPLVAIYPTTILFLVVLQKSPIDNGGLSQVQCVREQWHGDVHPADSEVRGSPIVFRHSVLGNSAVADSEDTIDVVVISTDDCHDTHSESNSSESHQSSVTMCDQEVHVRDGNALV